MTIQKISVCMTVYGHSEFLKDQLESIMYQTFKIYELVVLEDFSGQLSPKRYIEELCQQNAIQLKYTQLNKNIGPAEAFKLAITQSSGDLIFLSDHDDIWSLDRVEKVLPYHSAAALVISNGVSFTNDPDVGEKLYQTLNKSLLVAFYRNTLIGATLSIDGPYARKLSQVVPFLPMHDWVIFMCSIAMKKKILLTSEILFYYRRHSGTYTGRSKNSFFIKLKYRFQLLIVLLILYISSNKLRN